MEATNWQYTLQIEDEVQFDQGASFVALHFRSEDVPKWSLEGAPQHLTELYKFWAITHRIFVSKRTPSDVFMIQLESFIPSDDKLERCMVSPGVVFLFTFPTEVLQENLHVSTVSPPFEISWQ